MRQYKRLAGPVTAHQIEQGKPLPPTIQDCIDHVDDSGTVYFYHSSYGGIASAKPGDWLVNDEVGRLGVYSNQEFQERFVDFEELLLRKQQEARAILEEPHVSE